MIRDGVFSYLGWDVHLSGLYDGARNWLWRADVEGTDQTFIVGGTPEDDPELVRNLVCDWIDRGMPQGGPSA